MKILQVRVAAAKFVALRKALAQRFSLTPTHDIPLPSGEHELTFLLGPAHDEGQVEAALAGMLNSHQILNASLMEMEEAGEQDGGDEDEDEDATDGLEEESDWLPLGERSVDEQIACAQEALERMSEKRLQNVFGVDLTDVIFDGLNEYIERRQKGTGGEGGSR